jgi:heme-degrading monooxygenase HmoA
MYVVRDVFKCKPGHSRSVADKFKNSLPMMKNAKGFVSGRVLLDYLADYWTVVLEVEIENLGDFEAQMKEYGSNKQMQEAVKGYMDEVDGGYREVFKVV